MPIRPEDRDRYPVDWDEISWLIREANDWQCQGCGQQCRRPGEPFDTQRRTLSVAHWDSIYSAAWVLLVPLCTACHLRHDIKHAWRARRRNQRRRQRQAGQLELFRIRSAA